MSDKPRRWFQVHLSTAVVLMFVAGGFIWANCAVPNLSESETFWNNSGEVLGWPFTFWTRWHGGSSTAGIKREYPRYTFSTSYFLIDFVILLFIVAVVAIPLERRIHRRGNRKT